MLFLTGIYLDENVETCQTSKMESFAIIVNGFQQLTIFAKGSILRCLAGFWIRVCLLLFSYLLSLLNNIFFFSNFISDFVLCNFWPDVWPLDGVKLMPLLVFSECDIFAGDSFFRFCLVDSSTDFDRTRTLDIFWEKSISYIIIYISA